MRRMVGVLLIALVACGSSSSPPDIGNVIPPDLVPLAAEQASVTVTIDGRSAPVAAAVVSEVVPFLVRRVFEPTEPLSSYGLERPTARVDFTLPDGSTVALRVGGQDFDKTAYYVQRDGDGRVWLVLNESITRLLSGFLPSS